MELSESCAAHEHGLEGARLQSERRGPQSKSYREQWSRSGIRCFIVTEVDISSSGGTQTQPHDPESSHYSAEAQAQINCGVVDITSGATKNQVLTV